MTIRLSLLLLATCLVACGSTSQEWVREYPGYLPGTGWKDAASILVRDAHTGEPLPGVLIRQHEESIPTRDGHWAALLSEMRTDEYGIAWMEMPKNPGGCHWIALAEGYAPASEFSSRCNHEFDLERGRVIRNRIFGLDGRPVAGVTVGYMIGCAHAPILRTATTDARGIATFRGISLDGVFPYRHDGLAVSHANPTYDERVSPLVTYAEPGGPVEGRVLLADGRPASGGVILNLAAPHGPLAALADDGSFRMRSAELGERFSIFFEGEWHRIERWQYRPGGPFVHRIGSVNDGDTYPVGIDITGRPKDAPLPVGFERLSDGARQWSGTHDAPIDLPAGRYRAVLGDLFSEFVGESEAFDVPGTRSVSIDPRRQSRLDIEWAQANLKDGWASVYLGNRKHTWDMPDGLAPFLPGDAPAVLCVERDDVRRFFAIPPGEGVRRVVLRFPAIKRLAIPAMGDAYVTLHAAIAPNNPQLDRATSTLSTRATGEVAVVVEAEGEVRILRFDLPFEAPPNVIAPKRVERHRVPEERELVVVRSNGSPVAEAKVVVAKESLDPVWRERSTSRDTETGPRGRARLPWFRDGASVVVVAPGPDLVAKRVVLEGDGPYSVQWGDCSVTVVVSDADLEAPRLYCDGQLHEAFDEGVISLRGLDPGPHTLIIGAEGRRHFVHRIVLKPREHREIHADLPRRE